uniref:VWFA domain-containing protein n=1 Tax=Parascaris univalens TaxID=6257 RepID=A0A914ZNJ7_PARUN
DSTAMPETEFRKFRQFLRELYYSFESNSSNCRQISRLAILKNRRSGSVFTYLHLENSLDKLQVSIHLSKMEYAGCNLERNLNCQKALTDAYVLGTTLHATEQGGRRKALLIATSRGSAHMRALQLDLREAVEYARRNHVDVYLLRIGEQRFEGEFFIFFF